LWDSLAGVMGEGLPIELNANNSLKAIDIGTGGGFPGIPIAIALSNWQITLLDSTRKKVNFLADLVPQLQLNNIQTLLGRAEEIGLHPLHKNYYDLALIRAVGSPEICTKYTWSFLKPNGLAILYRGTWQQEDTTNLVAILKKMSGEIENIKEFTTPLTNSIRHCIYLRKK
jgi:16S rRNA (guanine527-N7)-methyltransferase